MRLPHGADLQLPEYQSALAAGLDLLAAVADDAPVEIAPGSRALIPTGVAIALPPGHEGQVRPRSGLAIRHGVTVLNSPGTVDADYRGELQVILVNLGIRGVYRSPRHADRADRRRAGPARQTGRDERSGYDRTGNRRLWFHRHFGKKSRSGRLIALRFQGRGRNPRPPAAKPLFHFGSLFVPFRCRCGKDTSQALRALGTVVIKRPNGALPQRSRSGTLSARFRLRVKSSNSRVCSRLDPLAIAVTASRG